MRKFLILLLILVLLLFLYCYFFRKGGCCITGSHSRDSVTVKHWINWNILFTPSSAGDSTQIIIDFKKYLTHYADSVNPGANLTFSILYCPCDSLLTNIDATLVYGSGNPVPPPPTKPNPGPSGDYALGNNLGMSIPDYVDSTNRVDTGNLFHDTTSIQAVPSSSSSSRRLAVIDTGLDTLLYKLAYPNTVWSGNLLWQDANRPTLFDVVIGGSTNMLADNNPVKHGTAATWVALSRIRELLPGRIPQIMSIRAFDDSERGSIYTVSCALSYAIQRHANFVNASWGYFGKEDSVLKHYVQKASDNSIFIIAAAGNTPGYHDPTRICNVKANTMNYLDSLKNHDSLFYPACFAPDILNLVSVTQLNIAPQTTPRQIIPCFYQNYSSTYITVGALENPPSTDPCCTFRIPFLLRNIEGSSFATPVVTGILMASLLNNGQDIKKFINNHAQQIPPPPPVFGPPTGGILNYTNNENYFNFLRIDR